MSHPAWGGEFYNLHDFQVPYSNPVDADGTPGNWGMEAPSGFLPPGKHCHQAAVVKWSRFNELMGAEMGI